MNKNKGFRNLNKNNNVVNDRFDLTNKNVWMENLRRF